MAIDECQRDDALDRFWDGLVHGVDPDPEGLAPKTAEVVRRLNALSDDPDPSRARVRAWIALSRDPLLKGLIMQTAAAPIGSVASAPPRRLALSRAMAYVATALLLVLTVGAVYFSLVTTPGSGVRPGDWPMWGGNPARTRVRPGAGPQGRPALLWTYPVGGAGPLVAADRGALADGVLYLPSATGLVALDAATGRERWRATGYGDAVVVDGDGLIVHGDIASGAPSLARLRRTDGRVVWTAEAGRQQPMWNPVVADGVGYTPSGSDFIAFDPANGKVLWRVPLAAQASRGASVADGLAVLGDVHGTVYGIAIRREAIAWTAKFDAVTIGHPVLADGTAYILASGGAQPVFAALDAATGITKWRFVAPTVSAFRPPAVDGTTVYLPCDDGTVYALDAATGTIAWQVPTGPVGVNPPALVGDTLYFATKAGVVYALDPATGAERWRLALGGASSDAALIGDRVYYLSTADGRLDAVGDAMPAASTTVRRSS